MKAQNVEMSGRLGAGLNQISQLDSDLGKTNNDLKVTGDLGTVLLTILTLISSPISDRFG